MLQTAASFCHFHQQASFDCPLRRCEEEEEEEGRKEEVKDLRFKIIYCCYVFIRNFARGSSQLKLSERQKINSKRVTQCACVVVEGGEMVKEEEQGGVG